MTSLSAQIETRSNGWGIPFGVRYVLRLGRVMLPSDQFVSFDQTLASPIGFSFVNLPNLAGVHILRRFSLILIRTVTSLTLRIGRGLSVTSSARLVRLNSQPLDQIFHNLSNGLHHNSRLSSGLARYVNQLSEGTSHELEQISQGLGNV
jgi:hypothetical protein